MIVSQAVGICNTTKDGESTLIMAARRGFSKIVSIICRNGGDVDHIDKVACGIDVNEYLISLIRMAYARCRGH